METLKPYSEYKPTGLPWLKAIPSHWEIKRSKHLFQAIDIRSAAGDEELLSVSSNQGVLPRRRANVTMFQAASYVGYKLCWKNDLVINSLWAWMQGLGVSKHHGIVSTAYSVYRLRQPDKQYARFYDYLFRSSAYLWELRVNSKGIWRSRYQLTDLSFLNIPAIIPPYDEQQSIVAYLDAQSVKINRFIRNKKKLIALLKEQKQLIIHQAVTRGLNPDVRLKPSGVEWLGDIPEHWILKRIKTLGNIRYGLGQPPKEVPNGLRFIRATNIKSGKIVHKGMMFVEKEGLPLGKKPFLQLNDIIVVRSGAYTADSAIVTEDYTGSIAGYDMVFTPKDIYPQFAALVLLSKYVLFDQLYQFKARAAQPHLNAEELGNALIALPSLIEQKNIVEHVDSHTRNIEHTIQQIEQEITLINEYRTRLISDVVTGKVDVRGVAVPLADDTTSLQDDDPTADLLDDDDDLLTDLEDEEALAHAGGH